MPYSIASESLADNMAESEMPDVLGEWVRRAKHHASCPRSRTAIESIYG
jgi:hypothetical protein